MPDKNFDELIQIFTDSHKSSGTLCYLIVILLHHRGLLSSEDLQVLKGLAEYELSAQALPHGHLSQIPVSHFLSYLDQKGNRQDMRSILTVIEGGLKND